MKNTILFLITFILSVHLAFSQSGRPRELGIEIGIFQPGKFNAITDVPGVTVGHKTLMLGDSVRTGVTAIIPHPGNLFQEKLPAAIYVGNGFGKLAGYTQVRELGNIETPIILTNTLSVPTAVDAVIGYTLRQPGNAQVQSVNAVVGETNDGFLNDIRGRHVSRADVLGAIKSAASGPVEEGNTGAGTGTICFGFKGGIGTSSRVLPESLGGYSIGVLVQTNFGGILTINGVPVGKELGRYPYRNQIEESADGSCMMVVITDAPLSDRNLERLAKRAMLGLARTGGVASNGSGDYVIAVSTAAENRIPYSPESTTFNRVELLNDYMTPLFTATIEATEEAIINSLFAAESLSGRDGHRIEAIPKAEILEIMKAYGRIK
ncbi:P1 family peptidase [Fulvivirga sedimenti]|uniref:P1 family peptidase n=1 Tax=Fulvivirga sedimenti TaxID=2879465 RepID=A0A9X1KYH7_9BACT|nr:P1 family peptidase [Fulvivirga sedimenti]MCA6073621.1 P1 family peptidase [Fulvivirga sedimenti]